MLLSYLGPGAGIGGIAFLLGLTLAGGFLIYAFVYLPIRQAMRKKQEQKEEE